MGLLRENACAMVARVEGVNLNAVATTNLFTVPVGKIFTPHYVVLRELSGDAALLTLTLGQTGAKTDFLNTQTLSNLNAAEAVGIMQPIPHATTAKMVEYTAGEIFCVDITAADGGGETGTFEVFGTLMDA